MVRFRNRHSAPFEGAAPGEVGEVSNPAAAMSAHRAGIIEILEADVDALPKPDVDELNRALDEIDHQRELLEDASKALDAAHRETADARKRIADLEAELSVTKDAANLRVKELEAEVRELLAASAESESKKKGK